MKVLKEMNNMDRGELLTRLFPEEVECLLIYIEQQCNYFLQNEPEFRQGWQQHGFITAEFWYRLVKDAYKRINTYQSKLWKHPRWFADNFFDGYDCLFTIYCLVEYADKTECNHKLRQSIHMLFGDERLLSITIKNN